MVGQRLLKSAILDFKPPTTSFLPRGFRFSPWKRCKVELVITDGESPELRICGSKDQSVTEIYVLEDINEVTACGSKTHAHAFEIISGNKSLVILSGSSEFESREWIWTLRKLFWPDIVGEPDRGSNKLQLVPTKDSDRLKLPSGVYEVSASVVCVGVQLLYKCNSEDSRQTPVEPFTDDESKESLSIPITTLGKLTLQMEGTTNCLVIETTVEYEYGRVTLMFKHSDDGSIETTMEIIKHGLIRATNNLHDCISSMNGQLV